MHIAKMLNSFSISGSLYICLDFCTHNPPAGMKTIEVEILYIWRVSFLGKTDIEHKLGDI